MTSEYLKSKRNSIVLNFSGKNVYTNQYYITSMSKAFIEKNKQKMRITNDIEK